MPHEFNTCGLASLLDDLKRVLTQAADHERRLSGLVRSIEGSGRRGEPAVVDRPIPVPAQADTTGGAVDLVAAVRELCLAARGQRQLAEALLDRLVGGQTRSESIRPHALVIDDSRDTRELVATALEAAGCPTAVACNGLDGVIAAHCLQTPVVLMDLTMPVLDGLEAARLLKASPATRHLQVIAHTGCSDLQGERFRRLFVDVLRKPTDPEVVVRRVQQLVWP